MIVMILEYQCSIERTHCDLSASVQLVWPLPVVDTGAGYIAAISKTVTIHFTPPSTDIVTGIGHYTRHGNTGNTH